MVKNAGEPEVKKKTGTVRLSSGLGLSCQCRLKALTKTVYGRTEMKSKKETKKPAKKTDKRPEKTDIKKKAAIKKSAAKKTPAKDTATSKIKKENLKLSKNLDSAKTKLAKAEKGVKKFFPKGAKPPAPPSGALEPKVASKRTPWMKKPIENPHSTPAGPCTNLKDLFDSYIDKKYKKLKDEQRYALWKQVSLQMLTEPFSRLNEIIDSHLSKK